jgi:hypothetical protein
LSHNIYDVLKRIETQGLLNLRELHQLLGELVVVEKGQLEQPLSND